MNEEEMYLKEDKQIKEIYLELARKVNEYAVKNSSRAIDVITAIATLIIHVILNSDFEKSIRDGIIDSVFSHIRENIDNFYKDKPDVLH